MKSKWFIRKRSPNRGNIQPFPWKGGGKPLRFLPNNANLIHHCCTSRRCRPVLAGHPLGQSFSHKKKLIFNFLYLKRKRRKMRAKKLHSWYASILSNFHKPHLKLLSIWMTFTYWCVTIRHFTRSASVSGKLQRVKGRNWRWILSSYWVTIDGVWIDDGIYWTLW
jgi:hypothetical protein